MTEEKLENKPKRNYQKGEKVARNNKRPYHKRNTESTTREENVEKTTRKTRIQENYLSHNLY